MLASILRIDRKIAQLYQPLMRIPECFFNLGSSEGFFLFFFLFFPWKICVNDRLFGPGTRPIKYHHHSISLDGIIFYSEKVEEKIVTTKSFPLSKMEMLISTWRHTAERRWIFKGGFVRLRGVVGKFLYLNFETWENYSNF